MTLLNDYPAGTGRSRPSSGLAGSGAIRAAKTAWSGVWLFGVPLLVSVYADMQVGAAWGVIPAFWLDGDQPFANTATTLAMLGVFAVCVVLHRQRADLLLGVLPIAAALAAHVGFGGSPAGWIGGAAGLTVGALVWRHRR